MSEKPYYSRLYAGFHLKDGVKVQKFVWRFGEIEEYLLTNGHYLNLSERRRSGSQLLVLPGGPVFYSISSTPMPVSVHEQSGEEGQDSETLSDGAKGFAAVAGMAELKALLRNDVIKPITESARYERFRLKPPNGILLYGPPGCGKTFIAQKLGEELGMSFIAAKHSDFASIYVHGAVEKISQVFQKARRSKPCILFIDEIEGLIPKRSALAGNAEHKHEEINEFLMQMNDLSEQQVIVVGASNQPDLIDEALLRTGRIDKIIYVAPPDVVARTELFRMYLEDRPLADNLNIADFAAETEGYSSSDIEYLCDEAARRAVDGDHDEITPELLRSVLGQSKSSISPEALRKYADFAAAENRDFSAGGRGIGPIGF